MQMDSNPACENADHPNERILEPDSNASWRRLRHPSKHFDGICSTDAGIQIEISEVQPEKAEMPKNEILDAGSKTTL
jgi:hypothetical protein